jgi:O-antigen/teichoic acid export membrane protein
MKKKILYLYDSIVDFAEEKMQLNLRYYINNGIYLLFLNFLTIVCALFLSIAFANFLPKEVYGKYQFILSVLGIVSIFSLPGIKTSLIQAVAKNYDGTALRAIKESLKWSFFGSIILFFISIYYFFSKEISLSISFLIISLLFSFYSIAQYYNPYLNGKKKFKKLAVYSSIHTVVYTILLISAAYYLRDVIWLVAVYLLTNILINGFITFFIFKKIKNKKIDKSSISFGKHLTVMEILQFLANYLDRIILSFFLGFENVAIYSIALIIPEKIKDLSKNIGSLILPKLAVMDHKTIKKTLMKRFLQLTGITIILMVVYITAAPFLIKLVFPKYLESIFYSKIFMLGFISFPTILFITMFQSKRMKKQLYQFNISFSVIQIILLILLTTYWGILGTILARVFTRLFGLGATLIIYRGYVND